jgi:hypothetical protein
MPMGKRRTDYNDTIENPGPGAYEAKTKKESSSFTIGKSKSLASLADTPGVGRYNVSQQGGRETKGGVFGRGKRANFISSNTAGVGDYQILQEKQQAKLGFGKADRFGKQGSTQPGPGDYHVHSIIGYKSKQKAK